MRCSDTAVFASSGGRPLTHALGHLQWPKPKPPRFVDATETSPAAVEEPPPLRDPTTRPQRASPRRPWLSLRRPTSPPAIVRCGDTPVFQSPGDRREQHKRKPRLIFTSASQAAKTALKERHTVRPRPEECAGVARPGQSPSAIATIRRDLPSWCHVTIWAFWVAIFRYPGRTPRLKNDDGELTKPRLRASS